MMRSRPRYLSPACLLCVWIALTGCGKKQEPAAPASETEQPVRGGTFTVAVDSDPGTLNPVLRTTALAGDILGIVSDGLVRMNQSLEFEPYLAHSWEWSDDGLTLTYHLRDDVRWSDGEPFVARDVVATYKLFVNEDVPTPRRSDFEEIDTVTAPDDTTVVFRFRRRGQEMILNSASFTAMPAHVIENLDPSRIQSWEINRAPIGNGPYMVTEWASNDRVVLERNPYYWGPPGNFDRIVFRIVPEESTRLLQLEIGEADMVESVPQKDVERLRDDPDVVLRRLGPRYLGYLVYNVENPLLADARVRNAISFAIDRRALIDGLLFGFGEPIANPMTPIISWAYDDDLQPHRRDVPRSRKLLADAGWADTDGDGIVDKDGQPFSVVIKTRTGDPVRENGVLVLQNNLREVGIDARPRMLELSTVLQQVRQGDFDIYMGQVSARLSPDLSTSFATGGGFNYGRYSNADVDSLISRARRELDRERAAQLWKAVQAILYEEQPMTMLYAKDPLVGLRVEIRGATPSFLSPYENIHRWWKVQDARDDTP